MLAKDKDALVCDLAETYHIYDYKELPVKTLAVLASGLRENSRIMMSMRGYTYLAPELVLPQIYDILSVLVFNKEDRPPSMTSVMTGAAAEKTTKGFKSGADFEAERERLIKEYTHA